jgi:hypothetical protein
MLGLLSSRIIHDLKNKLAVISGHAQFAEMTKTNPKAMADAIAIIKRVSEESGKNVEKLAKLRRALPAERFECPPAKALGILQQHLASQSGWTLQTTGDNLSGNAAIDPRWLAFLIRHFLTRAHSPAGTLVVDEARGEVPMEGTDVSPLYPEKQCLRIRFHYQTTADHATSEADPAGQFESLAAYEMIRRIEGGLVQQASPAGTEEITILIPMAPARTQAT